MTDPITDDELTAWKAMCEATTLGPWYAVKVCNWWHILCGPHYYDKNMLDEEEIHEAENNAEFAIVAHTAMPRLIAELLRVRAQAERLRAELLATPPTLEWLLSRLGQSSITKWHGVHDIHEWPCGIKWYRGHLRCVGPTGLTLMTRGCVENVLAAIAKEKPQ